MLGQSSSGGWPGSTNGSMLRATLGCLLERCLLERQHHLVNRRRADAKILPHVGLGRGAAVQACVEVDKRAARA
jgi:hypothetical protein